SCSVPNHNSQSNTRNNIRNREENRVVQHIFKPRFSVFVVDFFEFFVFDFFPRKKLNDFHSRQSLLNKGIQISHLGTNFLKSSFHFLLENSSSNKQNRHCNEYNHCQFPIHIQHKNDSNRHFHQVAYNHKQPLTENPCYGFYVENRTGN